MSRIEETTSPNNTYKRQSSLNLIRNTSKMLFSIKSRSSTSSSSSWSSVKSSIDSIRDSPKNFNSKPYQQQNHSPSFQRYGSTSSNGYGTSGNGTSINGGGGGYYFSSVNSTPFSQHTRITDSPTSSNFSFNSYESKKPSSILSYPTSEKRKKITLDENCCFCEESLTNTLNGESIVTLSCSHHSHFDCISMLMTMNYGFMKGGDVYNDTIEEEDDDINILCPICRMKVTCEDEDTKDQLIKSQLLSSSSYIDINEFDSITPNVNKSIVTPLVASDLNNYQLVTPTSQIGENFKNFNSSDDQIEINADNKPPHKLRIEYQISQISPLTREPPNSLSAGPDSRESTDSSNYFSLDSNNNMRTSLRHTLVSSLGLAPKNEVKVSIIPEFSKIILNNVEDEVNRYHEVLCMIDVVVQRKPKLPSLNSSPISSVDPNNPLNHPLTSLHNRQNSGRRSTEDSSEFESEELEKLYETKLQAILNITYVEYGDILFSCHVDVDMNGDTYNNVVCYLFEKRIVILGHSTKIIQNIDLINQISSLVQHESRDFSTITIILHLTSLDLPEVSLTISKKKQQLYTYLSWITRKLSKGGDVGTSSILRQSPGLELDEMSDNSHVSPLKIKQGSLDKSFQLDSTESASFFDISSPFGSSKKKDSNYSVDDENPILNLVLVISLAYNEDIGVSPSEYTQGLKTCLETVLANLSQNDKVGVVFIDKPQNSKIGNYYGFIDVNWEGWLGVIDSIECNTTTCENELKKNQWEEGIKYVELLLTVGATNSNIYDRASIMEVVFLNSNLFPKKVGIEDEGEFAATEPLWSPRKARKLDFFQRVEKLSDSQKCTTTFILLTDEFKYQASELLQNFEQMKKYSTPGVVTNYMQLQIVQDFTSLQDKLTHMIENFHKVSVRRVTSCLSFADTVRVIGIENNGKMIELKDKRQQLSSVQISFNNLHQENQKSILLKLQVDLDSISSKMIEVSSEYESVKLDYVTQVTKIEPIGAFAKAKELEQVSSLRFGLPGTSSLASLGENKDTDIDNINLSVDNTAALSETAEINSTSNNNNNLNFEILLVKCQSVMRDAILIRRQIMLSYLQILNDQVFQGPPVFDAARKESIKYTLNRFLKETENKLQECNVSNTKRLGLADLQNWYSEFQARVEDIVEGYSMRNYHLSNLKCCAQYFNNV